MPTIQVPLRSWSEVSRLAKSKRFRELAAEKITLKQQADRIKLRLDGGVDEAGRDHQGLSAELYLLLDELLPDGTQSVEFEGYMLTKIDAGTSSKFDKKALLTRPLPCTGCRECKRKKVVVFVTVKDIEELTTEGTRKPTVSAEKIKAKEEKSRDGIGWKR